MESLVKRLQHQHPYLRFVEGRRASWSAEKQSITYTPTTEASAAWALLHEVGHALLGHGSYESDMDLVSKEVAAWVRARELAAEHVISINEEHVQACLDTYRDWVHQRSICPTCRSHALQPSRSLYRCLNCGNAWKVSTSRFCRPYRLKTSLEN